LRRSVAALIDWFTLLFFTAGAIAIWVVYLSMQTGVPAKPAANIARLSPGYPTSFSALALGFAVLGTLAWLWLVHWRTRRSRHPLWKSMVLPAAGVSLNWLLVMTLLLPPLDHARSYRSFVERIALNVPAQSCVAAPGMTRAQAVALEYFGGYRVDAVTPSHASTCGWLLLAETRQQPRAAGSGWTLVARERRAPNDDEVTAIYRRTSG